MISHDVTLQKKYLIVLKTTTKAICVTYIQNPISPIYLILKNLKKFKYIFYCYKKLTSQFYVHSMIFAILMVQNNFRNERVTKNRTKVFCNHLTIFRYSKWQKEFDCFFIIERRHLEKLGHLGVNPSPLEGSKSVLT